MAEGNFPIDNNTYNLMQVLVSKLESIEAYQKYSKDGNQQLFQQLMQQDQQAAQQIVQQLKQALK